MKVHAFIQFLQQQNLDATVVILDRKVFDRAPLIRPLASEDFQALQLGLVERDRQT